MTINKEKILDRSTTRAVEHSNTRAIENYPLNIVHYALFMHYSVAELG